MKKILFSLCLLGLSSYSLAATPLIEDGTTSIHRRVLTTPTCQLLKNPSDTKGTTLAAFSRYYVYEDSNDVLAVGASTNGTIEGYLKKDCTVPWKMQTALMFTNRATREQNIIFDSLETLESYVYSDNNKDMVNALRNDIKSGKKLDNIIAQEPQKYVDYKKQFYLLPILQSDEIFLENGDSMYGFKVACVNKNAVANTKSKPTNNDAGDITAFKAAIVFVIDTTISMGPYIERTKKAIKDIVRQLDSKQTEYGTLADSVHFGLIAFRSNIDNKPQLEYVSKMFVAPGEATSIDDFEKSLANLKEAKVSTALFDEDAYSGVNMALQNINWNSYGGRYIVLITDAGAIDSSNALSSTGLDAKALRLEASHKGAALYTLHLLTESGKRNNDHQKAKDQYNDLSFNNIINQSLYYPVNAGDVNKFGQMVDSLAKAIADQVELASLGKMGAGSAANENELEQSAQKLGYAMQLAYLGSKQDVAAQSFLEGYISQRDLINKITPTVTPVVLLTKAQLSDLHDLVKNVIDSYSKNVLDSSKMFDEIRSLALRMGTDPNSIDNKKSISELGLMDEYLTLLPYKSELAQLDEMDWMTLDAAKQEYVIRSLESKLNYYQIYHNDVGRWVKLAENSDDSLDVYPVPLEALP